MLMQEDRLIKFKAKTFKALSDPIRLNILAFLKDGERCVCEIIPFLGVPQPIVSRHLKILKDIGLIKDKREGTRRFYSITNQSIMTIIDSLSPEIVKDLSEHAIRHITV
jgi:DNA-binding transcriptional ArsR family regulator